MYPWEKWFLIGLMVVSTVAAFFAFRAEYKVWLAKRVAAPAEMESEEGYFDGGQCRES